MKVKNIFFVLTSFLNSFIFGGFAAGTLVKSGNEYIPIEQLNVGDIITCYDFDSGYTERPITHVASSLSSACIFIVANKKEIITSQDQRFYSANKHIWKKASDLEVGDTFETFDNTTVIEEIFALDQVTLLFDITVQDCHNFLITDDGILVHNFLPLVIGFSWVFGSSVVEFTGVSLGIAALGKLLSFKLNKNKAWQAEVVAFDQKAGNSDAQAPVKPTEKDGFIPPKKGNGEKVKHRRGWGWKDKRGSIWIPTGPKGHGGPHWDVQHPDGTYDNIVPGGGVRGKK